QPPVVVPRHTEQHKAGVKNQQSSTAGQPAADELSQHHLRPSDRFSEQRENGLSLPFHGNLARRRATAITSPESQMSSKHTSWMSRNAWSSLKMLTDAISAVIKPVRTNST